MTMVIWSGGADSTLVLLQEIERANAARRGDKKHFHHGDSTVTALTFKSVQIVDRGQDKAREVIKEKIKDLPGGEHVRYAEVEVKFGGSTEGYTGPSQPQAAIWLTQAALLCGFRERVCFGWVREDDAWHYTAHLHAAWNALMAILGKHSELATPLEWLHKSNVIHELEVRGMLEHVWWCSEPREEDGDLKVCKLCRSCIAAKLATERLALEVAAHEAKTAQKGVAVDKLKEYLQDIDK